MNVLTLLHSEQPKLHSFGGFLSANRVKVAVKVIWCMQMSMVLIRLS